jgi:PAS domain-containing protein
MQAYNNWEQASSNSLADVGIQPLRTSIQAIWLMDSSSDIITCTQSASHLFGYTAASSIQNRSLPLWLPHHWATERGTRGMPIPVKHSSKTNHAQLFPAAAFRILPEKHPVLGDSAGCKSEYGQWLWVNSVDIMQSALGGFLLNHPHIVVVVVVCNTQCTVPVIFN